MKQHGRINLENVAIINDPGIGNLQRGQIAFANTDRFSAGNYDVPLTAHLASYEDPEDLWEHLERMIPSVGVSRRFNFKKHDKASAFLTEVDATRAIGTKFKQVELLGDDVDTRTQNKGLTMTIDKEEMDVPGIEELRTRYLSQRLARNEIAEFIRLLDAAASNSGLTWSVGKVDPDLDIYGVLSTAQKADGIWKNTALYGEDAWLLRRQACRRQATAGAIASALGTASIVASDLRVRDLIVEDKVNRTSKTSKARLVGSVIYLYYTWTGSDKDDPSDFKRFWSSARGNKLGVYRKEHDTGVDISVEHYSLTLATSGLSTLKRTIN